MANIRQKLVAKKVLLEGKSISQARREVGLDPHNTEQTINSKGWAELMQKYLPDEDLSRAHKQLLKKKEMVVVSEGNKQGSRVEFTGQIHSDAARALDMAYKLKNRYAPTKLQLTDPYDDLGDDELNAEIARLEKELGDKKKA